MNLVYLLLIVLLNVKPTQSLVTSQVCLKCDNVESVSMCAVTEICNKDEVCYMHHYIDDMFQERFDLGCVHPSMCSHLNNLTTHLIGKRTYTDTILISICESCCNGRSQCNRHLDCKHQSLSTINIKPMTSKVVKPTQSLVTSQICKKCDNVASVSLCDVVEICNKDEVCYMRKYINDMFNERVDLGCVDASMCSHSNTLTSHLIGKRTNSNIDTFILCEACCNGSSQCNSHLDCKHQSLSTINIKPMTSKVVKPTQSLVTSQICKKCDNVASVSMCDVVEICNKDEVCYMRKYINDMFNERFELGCVEASMCSHSNTLTSHLIGKRTNSNIDKFILCEACCNGSSQCNSHLDCKHQSSSSN
ncbi:uncharacterized protein [Mytilus edulis]|uniref:uncharacterized protein n=1 Tax=Mytilus edulis TaxID=6550 RepID=UPI0039F01515